MKPASKVQVPPHGTNPTNEQQNPSFQIHWPEQTFEDSEDILQPDEIVSRFTGNSEPFMIYKFLTKHFIDLVSENFFEGYTKAGVSEFAFNYMVISDTIFDLENHNVDRALTYDIKAFMEHVLRKERSEVVNAVEAMEAIVLKYGTLSNGLHHFTEQYRRNLTKAKV